MHEDKFRLKNRLLKKLSAIALMVLSFFAIAQPTNNDRLSDETLGESLNEIINKLFDFSDSSLYCLRLDSFETINNKIRNDTTRYLGQTLHNYCKAQLQIEYNNYINAEPILESGISAFNADYNIPSLNVYYNRSYKWLGEIKKSQGKYQEAVEAFRNSILYEDGPLYRVASTEKLIGDTYSLQGEWEKALHYYRKSLQILQTSYIRSNNANDRIETEKRLIRANESIANYYRAIKNIDSAMYYANQRRKYLNNNTESNMIDSHLLDGQLNFEMGKYEEANTFFYESLQLAKAQNNPLKIAEIYNSRTDLYYQLGRYHNAKMNADSAMMFLTINGNIIYKKDYLQALSGKTEAIIALYTKENTNDTALLNTVFLNAKKAMSIIDTITIAYQNIRDRQTLLGLQRNIFRQGIWASQQLFQQTGNTTFIDEALIFSDKSRSSTLQTYTQVENIKQFANMPDSVIQADDSMRIKVAAMEHTIRMGGSFASSEAFLTSFSQLKLKRQRFLKQVENSYPNYFALKYQSKNLNPKDLMGQLSPNRCVLEFFISKNDVYGFLITDRKIECKKLPISEEVINAQVAEVFRFIKGEQENKLGYMQTAYFLYRHLIAPFEPFLTQEVVIIADGNLTQLPFETLLYQAGSINAGFAKLPYLVKKYTLSYHYAAKLIGNKNGGRNNASDIAVFAPGFLDEPNFQDEKTLSFFQNDVKNSVVFKDTLATKQAFLNNIGKFKAVHINTHGVANDSIGDLSYIKLSDGNFYCGELYGQNIHADMVTLSACQTANGEVRYGEGTVGLTLGFLYAGARAVVSSLWNVNQQSTGYFMQQFYTNILQKNEASNEALRSAKLAMIDENPALAHPKYWAPFVLVGEPNAPGSNNNFLMLFAGAFLLILFFYVLATLKNKKAKK